MSSPHLMSSVPVIIVGAGPTGLAVGNLLGQAGIETLILERNPGLSSYCKAVSIDDEGLRVCQAMGLREAVTQHILSGVEAHYVSGRQTLARVAPGNNKNGFPLISTFLQPEFEAVLYEGLRRFPCVTTCFQHTVEGIEQTASSVLLSVRTPEGSLHTIECTYLLACDGGRSAIRHALAIPMQPATFQLPLLSHKMQAQSSQRWLVIDGTDTIDASLANDVGAPFMAPTGPGGASPVVTFYCNPDRPAVSVPTPHNGRRWEFMLLPDETEAEMLQQEKITALIVGAPFMAPTGLGVAPSFQVERKAIYRFHALVAESFATERVFLLGDAAHLMPPFGGQGMNSGLRDAHNLCWKLALVLQKRANPDLLKSYQQERRAAAIAMIRFSSFLGNIIIQTSRPAALARNALFALLNTMPPIQNIFTEARIKPQPKYAGGLFLRGQDHESRSLAGLMLPQPQVTDAEGHQLLLDEILRQNFALLRISDKPAEAFTAIQGEIWQQLNVRNVCLLPARTQASSAPTRDQGARARMNEQEAREQASSAPTIIAYPSSVSDLPWRDKDLFVLVRPDRYILGAFRERESEGFVVGLQRMLE